MELYTFDTAPNPRRLAMFIAHKGIDLQTRQVDLASGEQFSEAFRSINPISTVPALRLDDGLVLTEVIAICDYLESLYPQRPLLGRDARERALVLEWDHRVFVTALTAAAEILRNANPFFEGRALPGSIALEQIPALAERGRTRLRAGWAALDAELSRRPYLAGEHFSLADITLLAVCDILRWVREEFPADCPHLEDWLERSRRQLAA